MSCVWLNKKIKKKLIKNRLNGNGNAMLWNPTKFCLSNRIIKKLVKNNSCVFEITYEIFIFIVYSNVNLKLWINVFLHVKIYICGLFS